MTNASLMTVKSIAECSPWSILQYFWPALSDIWYLKPTFAAFESGRFRQVLLYLNKMFVFRAGYHKMLVSIANREDPDQTASSEAVWSGSALFV